MPMNGYNGVGLNGESNRAKSTRSHRAKRLEVKVGAKRRLSRKKEGREVEKSGSQRSSKP